MALDLSRDQQAEIPAKVVRFVCRAVRAGMDEREGLQKLATKLKAESPTVLALLKASAKHYRPSADFVLGHMTAWIATDIYLRLKQQQGGRPAEWRWNTVNSRFALNKFEAEFRNRLKSG